MRQNKINIGTICLVYKKFDEPKEEELKQDYNNEEVKTIVDRITEINKQVERGKLKGRVVLSDDDIVVLDLEKEYNFTVSPNEFIDKKTLLSVEIDKLKILEEKKSDDVIEFLKETSSDKIREKTERLRDLCSRINSMDRDIDNYRKTIVDFRKEIENNKSVKEKNVEEIKNLFFKEENLENYYKNIYKNDKVKSIKVVNYNNLDYLVVTTKSLDYKGHAKNYKLGSYKIFLPKGHRPKAFNVTNHYKSGEYHHPCIMRNGEICFGGSISSFVDSAVRSSDFASIIHTVINFLEEPNYGQPHIDEVQYSLFQKIDKKPKTDRDLLTSQYWQSLTWDTEKFRKDYTNLTRNNGGESQESDESEDEDL